MPIYAYRCEQCGHTCDVLQQIADPAPECPSCGDKQMSKQVTAAAFALKGTGWYKTDFANQPQCPAMQGQGAGAQELPPCASQAGCCMKNSNE